MEDLVGYAVAFGAIYVAYRYFTGGPAAAGGTPGTVSPASVLGFTPKRVTPDMVTQVQAMFPDIPYDNIQYDLLRTGSIETTCNKILERGFLPPPPQHYYQLYPTQPLPNPTAPAAAPRTTSTKKPTQSLISKFNLEERVTSAPDASVLMEEVTKGGVWESSAAQREANLRERKEKMILAARQRLLAQKQNEKGKGKAVDS